MDYDGAGSFNEHKLQRALKVGGVGGLQQGVGAGPWAAGLHRGSSNEDKLQRALKVCGACGVQCNAAWAKPYATVSAATNTSCPLASEPSEPAKQMVQIVNWW